jgi:hypothetical protein
MIRNTIAEYLVDNRMTPERLSALTDISTNYLKAILGMSLIPSLECLTRLAKAMEISLEELCGEGIGEEEIRVKYKDNTDPMELAIQYKNHNIRIRSIFISPKVHRYLITTMDNKYTEVPDVFGAAHYIAKDAVNHMIYKSPLNKQGDITLTKEG